LPECETGSTEPFCGDTGVEFCAPGGFETEVQEACGAGTECTDSGCVLVDDECPGEEAVGCGVDCELDDSECQGGGDCSVLTFVRLDDAGAEQQILRLSSDSACGTDALGCPDGPQFTVGVIAYHVEDLVTANHWVRVTSSPGWSMFRRYLGDAGGGNGCFPAENNCLVLPPGTPSGPAPQEQTTRDVIFQPETDPPLARNVTFEVVPEGTTCE